jgi:hypothetical protein
MKHVPGQLMLPGLHTLGGQMSTTTIIYVNCDHQDQDDYCPEEVFIQGENPGNKVTEADVRAKALTEGWQRWQNGKATPGRDYCPHHRTDTLINRSEVC